MGATLKRMVVDTSGWLALALASMTAFVQAALGLPFDLAPVATLGTLALLVYLLDHVRDDESGAFAGRIEVRALMEAAGLAGVALFLVAPAAAKGVIVAFTAVGFLYALPVPLPGGRRGRLKDLPGMKAWIVGAALTVGVVGLPVAWAGVACDGATAALVAFVFVIASVNVHVFDVRDVADDAPRGVATLPVLVGVAGTKRVLAVLLAVTTAAVGLAVLALEVLPLWTLAPMGAGVVATAVYLVAVRAGRSRAFYEVWVDGAWLVPGLTTVAVLAVA
ncbi:MAG: hypothetical protein EP329_19055 [Deltaproteobacteria bacterium]|nr:MAG: hypothetical protein EP329_19055 [Deltaproteobacteria bacterium]